LALEWKNEGFEEFHGILSYSRVFCLMSCDMSGVDIFQVDCILLILQRFKGGGSDPNFSKVSVYAKFLHLTTSHPHFSK
jgi:hypothetical protein